MTPSEAFQLGFFERCVAMGLDGPAATALVEKAAALVESYQKDLPAANGHEKMAFIGSALDRIGSVAGTTAGWAIPAAVIAPWLVGGAAGYGLGRATDIRDSEVDEMKHQKLIEEYGRLQEMAQQTAELRQPKPRPKRRPIITPSMLAALPPPSVSAGAPA